jgi:hypothetical protein
MPSDEFFETLAEKENQSTQDNREKTEAILLSMLKNLRIKKNRKEALTEEIEELSKEINRIESVDIPTFLQDQRYTEISLSDGVTNYNIKLKNILYVRIKKTNTENAFEFLKKYEAFKNKIKQKVSAETTDTNMIHVAQKLLREAGLDAIVDCTIHHKSLEAGFNEILGRAEGSEQKILIAEVPPEAFNIFLKNKAIVKEKEVL